MLDKGRAEFAAAAGISEEEAKSHWLGSVPMGRFLNPDEITPPAIYLSSRECIGMTGQALTISGGMAPV